MTRDAPIWRAPNIGSLEFAQKLSLRPLQSHHSQKLDARCAEPAKLERDGDARPAPSPKTKVGPNLSVRAHLVAITSGVQGL